MADVGHEERFLPPRLSAGCGFSKKTFAGAHGNGRDAPMADLKPAITKSFGFGPIPTLALVSHAVTLFWVCDICGLI